MIAIIITQFSIIEDVLVGYSRAVRKALKELVGDKSDTIARKIPTEVSHLKLT